jgi:hypothetical protein
MIYTLLILRKNVVNRKKVQGKILELGIEYAVQLTAHVTINYYFLFCDVPPTCQLVMFLIAIVWIKHVL